jgi:hypothetical protein
MQEETVETVCLSVTQIFRNDEPAARAHSLALCVCVYIYMCMCIIHVCIHMCVYIYTCVGYICTCSTCQIYYGNIPVYSACTQHRAAKVAVDGELTHDLGRYLAL